MKESKLLRILDKYVGSLLCLILSVFHRSRPRAQAVNKILLIELFEMGASVMAIPSIRFILRRQPNAQIFVLTTRGNLNSWKISGLVDPSRIVCLNGRSLWTFVLSAVRCVRVLRREGIDLSIDFEKFSRISVILSVLAGVRRRAGFHRYHHEGLYRGSTLLDAPCAFNQNCHIAFNFLALTKTGFLDRQSLPNLKEPLDPSEVALPIYEVAEERKQTLRKRIGLSDRDSVVVICPDVGANLRIRNYPVDSYARVAQDLLEDKSERFIAIIGMESNREICTDLARNIGSPRVINLCGKTDSLDELIELMSISELLIGNDNGPLHFASLTSTPILGIFSTDSPFVYGPLGNAVALYSFFHCSPCISAYNHKSSSCKESSCIKCISPGVVADMAKRLMVGQVQTRTINGAIPYLLGRPEVTPVTTAPSVTNIGRVRENYRVQA